MPDLIIHRLPFGGVAFEPVTNAGLEWLDQYVSEFAGDGGMVYEGGHACMAGFDENTYGFKPHDARQVATGAVLAGLTVSPA